MTSTIDDTSLILNNCFIFDETHRLYSLETHRLNLALNKVSSTFKNEDILDKIIKSLPSYFTEYKHELERGLIELILEKKYTIPEEQVPLFIITMILKFYNEMYSNTELYIKLFDFIHIENYFDKIYKYLNVISLSETVYILKSYNSHNGKSNYPLVKYLLEKGDKPLYIPNKIQNSCLYITLINDQFNLAYLFVKNGCDLYRNIHCFTETPLFYAMYIRGNRWDDVIIPEDQWKVIKLMLSKYSTEMFDEEEYHKLKSKITDLPYCSKIEKEQTVGFNPFSYASSGYEPDKLKYIMDLNPEWYEEIFNCDS